jgi:hypothetical protein
VTARPSKLAVSSPSSNILDVADIAVVDLLYADIRSVIETARRRTIGALEAIRLTLNGLHLPAWSSAAALAAMVNAGDKKGAKALIDLGDSLVQNNADSAAEVYARAYEIDPSTSPTLPIGALERRFSGGAGPKTRVGSTAPDGKSSVV